MIDDAAHPRVRAARRCRSASGRRRTGRFLAEGTQAVREALLVDGVVVEVLATTDWLTTHADLARTASDQQAPVHEVTDRVLRAVAETTTPQGVVAVCRDVTVDLASALAGSPRLLVVLAEVRDPGNAGTIIRTADAAGADAVVVTKGSVDPLGGKCVRSTVGSLFHLPVTVGHPPDVVDDLRAAGLTVLAADGQGPLDLAAAAARGLLTGPTAWLVGNEAAGLPPAYTERADARVRVPMYGRAESLNVSVAAALCLYASADAHRSAGPA